MADLQPPPVRRSQRLSVSRPSKSPSRGPSPQPKTKPNRIAKMKQKSTPTQQSAKTSPIRTKLQPAVAPVAAQPPTPIAPPPTPIVSAPPAPFSLPVPRVVRVYNNLWASTPASLAFIEHGRLPTTQATTTIALNILDYIIQPAHWNPALSHNKLSAACFMFASVLTGSKVTPGQVANACGWVSPAVVRGLANGKNGEKGYREVLEALDVSRNEVVEGYGILWDMRMGFKGVLGEYGAKSEGMLSGEKIGGWTEGEKEGGILHWKEVDSRMRGLGFECGKCFAEQESDAVEENAGKVHAQTSQPVDLELEEFEDFVAENE